MNQILVSQKVYVTPAMKKKKVFFKIEFFLSIFLLVALSSYCIYAEYDRNKDEAVSKEILGQIEFKDDTIVEQVIVITLNSALEDNKEERNVQVAEQTTPVEISPEQLTVTSDGTEYYTIGIINIPKINVNYPILSTESKNIDEILKISPCKFWGPNPNEVGNLCIVGHNYKNSKFFSKVPKLKLGDTFEIQDLSGKTLTYEIYDKFIVNPENTQCTSQITGGRKEVTLITCTNDNEQRVIVKAKEVI